jgi:hypothetical protein
MHLQLPRQASRVGDTTATGAPMTSSELGEDDPTGMLACLDWTMECSSGLWWQRMHRSRTMHHSNSRLFLVHFCVSLGQHGTGMEGRIRVRVGLGWVRLGPIDHDVSAQRHRPAKSPSTAIRHG